MAGRDKLDCVPLFLGDLADDIFVCGKTINLLKLCCPEVRHVQKLIVVCSKHTWVVSIDHVQGACRTGAIFCTFKRTEASAGSESHVMD